MGKTLWQRSREPLALFLFGKDLKNVIYVINYWGKTSGETMTSSHWGRPQECHRHHHSLWQRSGETMASSFIEEISGVSFTSSLFVKTSEETLPSSFLVIFSGKQCHVRSFLKDFHNLVIFITELVLWYCICRTWLIRTILFFCISVINNLFNVLRIYLFFTMKEKSIVCFSSYAHLLVCNCIHYIIYILKHKYSELCIVCN